MGCACEDGSRDSFYAVIKEVLDREMLLPKVEKLLKDKTSEGWAPLLGDLRKKLVEASDDRFSITVIQREGGLVGETSMSGDLLPQSKEWFKERIGKTVHVVLTQLPKRRGGSVSVDVHDMEK